MDDIWYAGGEPGYHDPQAFSVQNTPNRVEEEKPWWREEDRNQGRLEKLLAADFICEARYTTWLANVVMVTKSNGKWRMCVDYTYLNRACPKDSYQFSRCLLWVQPDQHAPLAQRENHLCDRWCQLLLQGNIVRTKECWGDLPAVHGYRPVHRGVHGRYRGKVWLFRVARQRPGRGLRSPHANMRLNPEKCTFEVEKGKFLGFMLTHWEIEANLEKCRTIAEMRSPQNVKEVQQLMGRLIALSRFVPRLAERTKSMVQLHRKASKFSWDEKCSNSWRTSCHLQQTFRSRDMTNLLWCT